MLHRNYNAHRRPNQIHFSGPFKTKESASDSKWILLQVPDSALAADSVATVNPASRTVFVSAARLPGWVDRFSTAHGTLEHAEDTDDGVLLRMRDGATALLTPPWPDDGRPGRGGELLARLASVAAQERQIGIVLVRRGGYAVGIAVAGKLLAHKVGSPSARSRGGDQGTAIVERASQEGAKIFGVHRFEYLATGGDKQLVESVLAAPTLRKYAKLARLAPLPVADPKMDVLTRAAADFCAVRIHISDAHTDRQ